MARVLLLDGDTRQVLPFLRALRRGGHEAVVTCESRLSMGWLSRYPSGRRLLPSEERDREGYAGALLELVRRERFDLLIPLFDLSAHVVAERRAELDPHVTVALAPLEIFLRARDKAATMRICQEHGVPCPRTAFPDEVGSVDALVAELGGALIVKPRIAHGAAGLERVDEPARLADAIADVEARHGPAIVQELVPQTDLQLKAELFRDEAGTIRAAVVFDKPRYFPVTGGTSSLNRTVDRPDVIATCTRLLDAMEWVGYADVDLIQDPRDGVAKVMEVNPRVTGSVKIAFEAGVDFAELMVRHYTGGAPVPSYPGYRTGISMRYLPLDLLWFLFSPERFRARPSWFRFWGRDVCYQVLSLRDPLPFLGIFLSGVAKLLSPEVRRAKLRRA